MGSEKSGLEHRACVYVGPGERRQRQGGGRGGATGGGRSQCKQSFEGCGRRFGRSVDAEGGEKNGKLCGQEAEALGRRLGTWGPRVSPTWLPPLPGGCTL